MRIKLLACGVLRREISYLLPGCEHPVDVTYLRQGLHNEPERLRSVLQAEIDAVEAGEDLHSGNAEHFDAICLAYGLCCNGTAGLRSSRVPLVIPRAHDCITLLLGDKDRYDRLFHDSGGGIYWYSGGWIENAPMPSPRRFEELRRQYAEQYGEENADWLLETETAGMKRYSAVCYIDWPEIGLLRHRNFAAECAEYFGLNFMHEKGSRRLLWDLMNGRWNRRDFLVLPPGDTAEASGDTEILRAV